MGVAGSRRRDGLCVARLLVSEIPVCLILSKILTLYLPSPANECRNSFSYVFSGAGGLVPAHGPLIINFTLCAGRLIIPT